METIDLIRLIAMVVIIIGLSVWAMVKLERRDRRKDAQRMSDPTIFHATASIEGAQGTISDIEFGDRLEDLIVEAKARGCRGLDVAWLNRAGEPVNRTVMNFTR